MSKVLVVSAHPDDEVLGCGGTLLKHANSGDELYWLITTKVHSGQGFSDEWRTEREQEILKMKELIGIKEVHQLGHPAMQLNDTLLNEMIPQIGKLFQKIKPEVIYVLNRSDAHSDHLITFRAVMACTKSFRYPSIKKVLMYECLSETEFGAALPENVFIPTYFVDISAFMEKKLELMKVYNSELGTHPFPRSLENIKALAHFRGASASVHYAEAFQLLKYIEK